MKQLAMGVGLALVLAPSLAQAQAAPEPKLFVRPTIGAVVGSGPGATFSTSLSFRANDKVQITAEFGSMQNILPSSVGEEVEVSAAQAANALGGKHSATASADAGFGQVGFRYRLRDVSGAQTFFEAGAGMAHVTSDVTAVIRGSSSIQGDISDDVVTPFTSGTPSTKPMFSVGGGIILTINRKLAVEMGARYIRINTDGTAINMANASGAFRIGF